MGCRVPVFGDGGVCPYDSSSPIGRNIMDSISRRWMEIPVPEEHVIKVMAYIAQLDSRPTPDNGRVFAAKERDLV